MAAQDPQGLDWREFLERLRGWFEWAWEEMRYRYESLDDDQRLAIKGAIGTMAVGGLVALGRREMPKKVFISYDYENDKHYRRLLSAWDANANFSFEFEDHSTPYINSDDAARIKAAISRKMADANCLLVIVGKHTSSSAWVTWEIEKAKELELRLVGVKVDRSYTSPSGLLNAGTSWAHAFDRDPIVTALENC
jgi:antiphage defense system Thoeris ThsB-like protein